MEEEDEWELNTLAKEMVSEKCLVGCLYTVKLVTKKLVETLVGRPWKAYKNWEVRINLQEETRIVVGVNCVNSQLCKMLLEKLLGFSMLAH